MSELKTWEQAEKEHKAAEYLERLKARELVFDKSAIK